jgi:hypothetical protein
MKLLYTNENRFLVYNIYNIVENSGIGVVLKNEYAGGAVGEIPPFESWLELWVVDEADYAKALRIIESSSSPENAREWVCRNCGEKNDASFEVCWNCQLEHL